MGPARLILAAVLALGAAACGAPGLTSDAGAGDAALADNALLPRGIVPVRYQPVSRVAGTCATPPGAAYQPSSTTEVASLMLGRWRRCGGSFADVPPPDGLAVGRDRSWRYLRAVNGALEPDTGPDGQAVWFLSGEDPRETTPDVLGLRLLFVPPTSLETEIAYELAFTQGPTGVLVAGQLQFVWLGD